VCVISLIASGSGRWKLRKLVIVITLFEKLENYIGAKVKKPKERETTCASLLSLQFSSVLFPTRLPSVLSALLSPQSSSSTTYIRI
jgi:hypothetical protein